MTEKKETKDAYVRRVVDESMRRSKRAAKAAKAAKAEGCKCGQTHVIEDAVSTSRKTHDRCRDIINNRDLQINVLTDSVHELKSMSKDKDLFVQHLKDDLKAKDERILELIVKSNTRVLSTLAYAEQKKIANLQAALDTQAQRNVELQKQLDDKANDGMQAREEARHKDDQLRRLEQYRTELAGKVARYKKFADRYFNGDLEVE